MGERGRASPRTGAVQAHAQWALSVGTRHCSPRLTAFIFCESKAGDELIAPRDLGVMSRHTEHPAPTAKLGCGPLTCLSRGPKRKLRQRSSAGALRVPRTVKGPGKLWEWDVTQGVPRAPRPGAGPTVCNREGGLIFQSRSAAWSRRAWPSHTRRQERTWQLPRTFRACWLPRCSLCTRSAHGDQQTQAPACAQSSWSRSLPQGVCHSNQSGPSLESLPAASQSTHQQEAGSEAEPGLKPRCPNM